MIYECLLKGGAFIVAMPQGHVWSDRERQEFALVAVDLYPTVDDYEVNIAGVTVMASRIDAALVGGVK